MFRGKPYPLFSFSGFAKGSFIHRYFSTRKEEASILLREEESIMSSSTHDSSQYETFSESIESDPNFDDVEASAQEMHDLCYGMIAFLRRGDPGANPALFQKRSQRRLREPVPEQHRRLLHGHYDRSQFRVNNFRSKCDLEKDMKLYFEMGEKVLLLLNQPLLDRMISNAGKCCRDRRSDGINSYRNIIAKASWRTFPHRWYRHSPFEIQKLRADIRPVVVENARFYRDNSTLRYLFSLMEPKHPYRDPIEKKMFELTEEYNPHK